MTTPNLGLVELTNSQGQYLNANETFAILDALVGKVVIDKDLNTPPVSPSDGNVYIVGPSPTGLWSGQANKITFWSADAGEWVFVTPREGWRFEAADEDSLYRYTGSAWVISAFIGGTLSTSLNEAPIVTLASASTVNIGAASANTINISGTTTITAFDSIASGAERTLVFQGVLTLTHNATSLILPGGASITTAAGDTAEFVSLGSGNWRCTGYDRANGTSVSLGPTSSPTFSTLTLTNGQIVFPATQVPSANANTLDDYEEGTWTPVLTFATPGDLSITYTNQTGLYTKIGRQVSLLFTVISSSFTHSTASGNLLFTGVPFTASSARGYGAQEWRGITKASYTDISARINVGASQLDFIASGSGVAMSNVVAADTPSGGTMDIRGFVTFFS